MRELWIVYGIINGTTFFTYGIDKLKAQAGSYRIPEKVLIMMALFGPIGGFLGMKLFNHKTRKTKFRILVPTFLAIHLMVGLFYTTVNASEGPSSWAEKEYNIAVSKSYITDRLKTNLQQPITRLEFVELIVKSYEKVMGEISNITDEDNPFTDTTNLNVVKAYKMGFVTGVTETTFAPDTSINREQLLVMFVRMNTGIEERTEESIMSYEDIKLQFEDVEKISTWAYESVQVGVANELITGVGENILGPKVATSREQAVLINLRLMEKYEANSNLLVYDEAVNNKSIKTMENETGYITTEILNMRSTPDLTSSNNIVRKLKLYEQVTLLEKQGEWYHITASGNLDGYVYTDYVKIYTPEEKLAAATKLVAAAAAVTNQSGTASNIINYAKQFQGTRYVYAGTSLTGGIDCSGFTQKVMAKFGISLSRSSSGQYSNGISVSKNDLRPGDLVYYGYSGRVSHVAIYIGNSQVIHANTTYGVSITAAYGWMHKPVIGYRRVIL